MVEAQVREVAVDGGAVALVELGTPSGRTIVALSGLSDGLAPVTEDLARAALPELPPPLRVFRFLVVSYRDGLGDDVTTRALARDTAAVIEAVAEAPVAVTGHSMGGMVAQHLAAARPDLVDRLCLSATAAAADHSLRAGLDRWDALVRAGAWREFYRDAVDVSFTGRDRTRRRIGLRLGGVPNPTHLVPRHLALADACRRHDATAVLGGIRCPTLVLAGSRDPLIRPAAARALAEGIPGASFEVFEGLGHGFPEQAWRRYVRRLVAFLAAARTDA